MKTGEMLKNSAAMPVLEQWLFLACPDRYENDARWRIFNVRAWARSKCAVLVLFFLCNVEHSPGVPGVVGTYQSKAQAIESGRGLRRSYQPVVGLEGVPSEASDKVAKQPLRSTT